MKITIERTSPTWRPWSLTISSGDGEDHPGCKLHLYLRWWSITIALPQIIHPWLERHQAGSWDAATVARMGRDWYDIPYERRYGFQLHDGFLQVFLGRVTHDSSTDQNWCCHLPWMEWRFHRFSLFDLGGRHFWTALERDENKLRKIARAAGQWHGYEHRRKQEDAVDKITFAFLDLDGEKIYARCHIQELEWRFGSGAFAWLSLFRRSKVRRSLDLAFDREQGYQKGSWKGGTIGTSCAMFENDSPEWAFRRHCAAQGLQFVGRAKHDDFRERAAQPDGDQPKAAVPV